MSLGKALGFISPAAGLLTGNGAGFLPYLSPGFGLLSGHGWGDDEERKKMLSLFGGGMMGGMQKGGMFGSGAPMGLLSQFGGGGY